LDAGAGAQGEKGKGRDVKKDILAAITFLATGLLFYVVQTDVKADARFSPGVGCDAAERVLVEKSMPEPEIPVVFDEGVPKDS